MIATNIYQQQCIVTYVKTKSQKPEKSLQMKVSSPMQKQKRTVSANYGNYMQIFTIRYRMQSTSMKMTPEDRTSQTDVLCLLSKRIP